MRKRKKSKVQERIDRFFQVNQEEEKPKKSRFQQRLEEMQAQHKKENPSTEDLGPGKVNLHDKDNPIPWISELDEKPPYYTSVDIFVDCEVYEDWARVSHGGEVDGKDDFYVNNRNSAVIYNITHWRKRDSDLFKYRPYKPMTEDDIKQVTYRDLTEVITLLEKEMITDLGIEWHEGFNQGISNAIQTLKEFINKKRMTEVNK